jgi:hypothetical protein
MKPILQPSKSIYYVGEAGCTLVHDWLCLATDGKEYKIPAGFWFNGGSIPAAFWQATFTPFDMRVIHGFLFHDWAYSSHCCDKDTADLTLQKIIDAEKLSVKGALVAAAVFAFGKSSWKLDATDRLYMRQLRQIIIESGRNPSVYCL